MQSLCNLGSRLSQEGLISVDRVRFHPSITHEPAGASVHSRLLEFLTFLDGTPCSVPRLLFTVHPILHTTPLLAVQVHILYPGTPAQKMCPSGHQGQNL